MLNGATGTIGLFVSPPLIGVATGQLTLLLAQAAETAPATQESPWSPAMVTALFAGGIGLLGAVTTMLVTLYGLRKEARVSRAAMAAQVTEVHDLVNSSNSALLEKVERLTARVASLSGREADAVEAVAAARDVAVKAEVTAAATAKRDAADAEKKT